MAERLAPGDLPETPWALKWSLPRKIGRSMFRGGPYYRVTNNEAWLRALQLELQAGPGGPRSRNGALREDLVALAAVLAV